jgi:hypothetical protein
MRKSKATIAAGDNKRTGSKNSVIKFKPVEKPSAKQVKGGDPFKKLFELVNKLDPALVRKSRQRDKFLEDAVNKYDIVSLNGDRLLYAKEVEGDRTVQDNGVTLDVMICLLSVQGEELLRMEGSLGSNGEGAHYAVYHDNTLMGDIMQTNGRRSDARYDVVGDDDKTFAIIELSDITKSSMGRWKNCICKPKPGGATVLFDINLPNRRRRLGHLGNLSQCLPDLPSDYKKYFGVKFLEQMPARQKSLLLAALFILKIPPVREAV